MQSGIWKAENVTHTRKSAGPHSNGSPVDKSTRTLPQC